ncbi:hypothetical protein CTAYLR_002966 [Chrysophaeum taylorii]|uniref:Uncharacterized protein n=1 Tax=Chrysophaeum taylorii TaxID=2483200 RepID=A0AAD7XJD5_9STRA|nr:hypothetical protein CTAYLR_002966 [Chrysophaeum taylorii]
MSERPKRRVAPEIEGIEEVERKRKRCASEGGGVMVGFEFLEIPALREPEVSGDLQAEAQRCREALKKQHGERVKRLLKVNRKAAGVKPAAYWWRFEAKENARLPARVPQPRSVAWNALRKNFHVDDDPVLRYVPYFGDDDKTGVDISAYDAAPCATAEALSEADEVTAAACLRASGDVEAAALATALTAPRATSDALVEKIQRQVVAFLTARPTTTISVDTRTGLRVAGDYAGLSESYRDLFCRRCYAYDCAEHGARQPFPRGREDPPGVVYGEKPLCFGGENDDVSGPLLRTKIETILGWRRDEDQQPNELFRRQRLALFGARNPTLPKSYFPCDHEGDCSGGDCTCAKLRPGGFCEKYCACPPSCRARFPGCRCKQPCRQRATCECVANGRECDPDLCKCCAGDACVNRPLALNRHKRLALGRSSTHGWGTFALQAAKAGDFVGEYRGELVSHDEADRRGKIYDKLACSFLFNLDDERVVDATRQGSKMKFANHNARDPNLMPRVALVDGDYRIGMYAKRDLHPGDELSFNYSPAFWDAAQVESRAAKASVL